jgi:carbon monoxide dehydrogenase subunit G
MKLHNEFTVAAPLERAWDVMLDVERVAPCLPGAAIDSRDGDDYAGSMAIKIGPITARYAGTVRILEADEAAHRAVMRAQAAEQRGQGTAAATITSILEPAGDGTRVRVETDMQVSGPAAQFGRGVMQDVSTKLMKRFADCLAAEIGAASEVVTAAGNRAAPAAAAPDLVPTGTAGVPLPPGPAGEHAEAVARARAQAASGAPTRSPASPPAADDVAGPPREDVLDLGEAARGAVLKRALPVVAAAIVAGVVIWRLRR